MPRLSVREGLDLIAASLRPLGSEEISVSAAAFGRILDRPAVGRFDVPRFRASAMDGFALRCADIVGASEQHSVWLPVLQEVRAGAAPDDLLPGGAAAISTGAQVPDGADTVLAREQTQLSGDRLRIVEPGESGRNIRLPGEDFPAGRVVLEAGARIGPAEVAALAACGIGWIAVRRMPRLALIATGSELQPAGDPPASAGIADSNGPMIVAAAAELGLSCDHLGCLADEAGELSGGLDGLIATGADILVSTGGVSGGSHDLVRAVLEARGARILFHGLAMRPGKPLLFAIMPDGRPFFGLPGNPVAALVAFRFFVVAAVRRLLQLAAEEGEVVEADGLAKAGTTMFLRCRLIADPSTGQRIDTSLDQRSHILSSVIRASHWLRVEATGEARLFPKTPTLG
jgi:molybdopterin molybdotransferase